MIDLIKQKNFSPDNFLDLMIELLELFCLYRPDIGYVRGLDKIMAQILLVFIGESKDLVFDTFSLFCNLVLSMGHLPAFYLT